MRCVPALRLGIAMPPFLAATRRWPGHTIWSMPLPRLMQGLMFHLGHAPMAVNIPFAFLAYAWDDEKKAFPWSVNGDFVALDRIAILAVSR